MKILLLIFLILLSASALSDEKVGAELLLQQQKIIEKQFQLLEQKQLLNEKQIDQKFLAIDNRYQSFENDINKTVLPRWWEHLFLWTLVTLGAGGGFGALLAGRIFKKRVNKIEQEIADHFEEKIKEFVKEKPEVLSKLVREASQEERFKQKSRLLIVTDKIDNQLAINFKKAGFVNIESKKLSDTFNESDYGLVILDSLGDEALTQYLKNGKAPAYLVYTEGYYKKPDNLNNFALANSKITLYPRTMELLTYNDMQREV